MSRHVTSWRRRVVSRFYQNEACARTIQERDHWCLCREILRRALEGWRDPWVAAHYYTFGLHPTKYQAALAARAARQLWELHRGRVQAVRDQRSNKVAA